MNERRGEGRGDTRQRNIKKSVVYELLRITGTNYYLNFLCKSFVFHNIFNNELYKIGYTDRKFQQHYVRSLS